MKSSLSFLLLASSLGFVGCGGATPDDTATGLSFEDPGVIEDKVIMPTNDHSAQAERGRTNNITYHNNAPVMTGGVNIYYIWYGSWGTNTATTILPDFASNVGGSSYWGINTTYYSQTSSTSAKTYIPNTVAYTGSTTVAYPYGTALSDANVLSVVTDAIGTGTPDANAIYFVLTSSDVNETSGFCTSYCGWHSHATIKGVDTKYSFVGSADRCLSSCASQTTSPNSNAGADAMVSIIAHEAEEAATDPDLNAWYDSRGYENADKCAWTYGTTSTASNGSRYNVTMGSRNYLIQQNWSATTQACAMR